MRFSLKWLFVAVAFVAVSLVAMLNANDPWRIGFQAAAIFSAVVALLGAMFSIGTTRAFCAGYAIVTFLVLTDFIGADWASDLSLRPALRELHSRTFSPKDETVSGDIIGFAANTFDGDILNVLYVNKNNNTATVSVIRPRRRHFAEIGHAAVSIVLGVVGGFIAVAFYRRRHPNTT